MSVSRGAGALRAAPVLLACGLLLSGLPQSRAYAATHDPIALAVAEDARVLHAYHVALHHRVPFVVPGRVPTLVLPARPRSYRLPELARREPNAVTLAGGRATLHAALVAMPGATLVLDSNDAHTVVLSGGPAYVSIVGLRAAILVRGHRGARLRLTGDGRRGAGGRPYLLASGGSLEVDATDVTGLGFGLGRTSGVAWLGGSAPVRGGAVDSTFAGSHNGAFAAHAPGLRFTRDTFARNEVYGLELYDASSRALVTDSRAEGNGRHGFLVSRGCNDVVLRRLVAVGNRGGGVVVDDGRSDGADSAGLPARGSDRAQLVDVTARGNAVVGIAVNGGTATVVNRARIAGGRFGVWVQDGASGVRLEGVTVTAAAYGDVLLDGARGAVLHDVSALSGRVGLLVRDASGTRVSGLQVRRARLFGVRFVGEVAGSSLTGASIEGRGPRPIDVRLVDGPHPFVSGVATGGWVTSYHLSVQRWLRRHPTAWSWAPVVGLPLVFWLPARRGRRGRFVLGSPPEDEAVRT